MTATQLFSCGDEGGYERNKHEGESRRHRDD